ncbi:putative transcriptional regulator [Rhizobium miluonense]|uniref:Transcriptional regulator n=1 Tax=Rhizobium miluonense TaxID=411945 RepID=A0ABU1SW27_9HYPH|nr:putative transcriptional regulator [Rhizobium miluonense]
MVEVPNSLIIDLLVFLKAGPRPYQEVMDAWRTSCPRLPIWEDAVDLGLIEREQGFVVLTEAGRNLLPS